jgi:hypothetical protein
LADRLERSGESIFVDRTQFWDKKKLANFLLRKESFLLKKLK